MNPQMYRDGYTKGVDDAEVTKKYLDALDLQLRYEGPGNVAAILMESIVGANGVILPPDGYMEGVRALCDKYGILLICDEVMAGFYRTGKNVCIYEFRHETGYHYICKKVLPVVMYSWADVL